MWSFRSSSDKKHCCSSRVALPQLTEAFLLPHGFKPVVILAAFSLQAAPWAVNLRFWPFRVLKPEVNIRMMALNIQVSLSFQFPLFDPVLSPGVCVWLLYLSLEDSWWWGTFSFVDCSGSLAILSCIFLNFSSSFFLFSAFSWSLSFSAMPKYTLLLCPLTWRHIQHFCSILASSESLNGSEFSYCSPFVLLHLSAS